MFFLQKEKGPRMGFVRGEHVVMRAVARTAWRCSKALNDLAYRTRPGVRPRRE